MSPQSDPHAAAVGFTADALRAIFSRGFFVREEKPLVLSETSEPEPDVVVARGSQRETPRHPTPANTVLVVEVADSSLNMDRTLKLELYARHGIPEYWILNLRDRQLEVFREPSEVDSRRASYLETTHLTEHDSIAPLGAPAHSIAITDLLPSLI
nr:hypothetical protein Hi04_10k_c2089_00005 [uncultured bacterium]